MSLRTLRRIDWPMLSAVLMLCGLGLLSLWTIAGPTNLSNESIPKQFFTKQLVFLGVSIAAMALVLLPGYLHARKIAYIAYGLVLAMLVALLVMGRYTRGARGWFAVGPINVQPAEFMKIAVVLALARWLSFARDLHTWKGLVVPFAIAGLPAAVIFVQPDLGNAILFFPALMIMLYVAGARPRNLVIILIAAAVLVPVAYRFGMKDYQRARLTSFIWPERSREASYQQQQSIKAVAAGCTVGRGLGESGDSLPYYVPDRHTDFVYSIIAEELGFVGSTFVIMLFAFLFWRGSQSAMRTREPFGRLLTAGLLTFLAVQVFINIGMTIGVAPITGLTLPFVSYGGSSLLTCFLVLGLLLNVAARWVPTFSSQDLDRGHRQIHDLIPSNAKWLVH